mgnify:CR=1 FL=1|tara:strand:- start:2283 stop:2495 length:213 start_codon:yes stop_codon:yes gene_type:complete
MIEKEFSSYEQAWGWLEDNLDVEDEDTTDDVEAAADVVALSRGESWNWLSDAFTQAASDWCHGIFAGDEK